MNATTQCLPACIGFCQNLKAYAHAPGCPNDGKNPFARIELDGDWMIVQPHDVADIMDGDEGQDYKITTVWMTNEEFEAMPEHGGF